MAKSRRGYVKEGIVMELIVGKDIDYQDLVMQSNVALELAKTPVGHAPALFTSGGALIKEQDDWTLGVYMRQQHRGPGKTRLGIGFIEMVGGTV